MERIIVEGITSAYGRKQVLSSVNLSAKAGECVGLVGANGCGKSTLLNILAGMRGADGGRILFDGQPAFASGTLQIPLSKKQQKQLFIHYTGYVPQESQLIEELTVQDNLLLWYGNVKLLKAELEQQPLCQLGLKQLCRMRVKKLSGGQKKRVSIGCALAGHPPILLLDEPGAALDLPGRAEVKRYLQSYKQMGGIIIIATHEESDLELCDKLYALKNGISREISPSLRGDALMQIL